MKTAVTNGVTHVTTALGSTTLDKRTPTGILLEMLVTLTLIMIVRVIITFKVNTSEIYLYLHILQYILIDIM